MFDEMKENAQGERVLRGIVYYIEGRRFKRALEYIKETNFTGIMPLVRIIRAFKVLLEEIIKESMNWKFWARHTSRGIMIRVTIDNKSVEVLLTNRDMEFLNRPGSEILNSGGNDNESEKQG